MDLIMGLIEDYDLDINNIYNLQQIINIVNENKCEDEVINIILNKDFKHKNTILNNLAVIAFDNKIYDIVIPFLQASYELDPHDIDTLYNFSFFLLTLGENELATRFLNELLLVLKITDNKELIKEIEMNCKFQKILNNNINNEELTLKQLEQKLSLKYNVTN